MHINRVLVLIMAIFFAGQFSYAQQRPITGTYMFNGLLINPAYAGSLNLFSATFVHRDQWVNIDEAPTLQSLTAHSSFKKNRIGIGIAAYRDQLGVTTQSGFYGSYAYKIRMSGAILAMGIQGGFDNREIDFSRLDLFNLDDPLLSGNESKMNPNFGTGVYLANREFFVGLSVPYILENKVTNVIDSEARESRYYYGTAGAAITMSKLIKLNPSVLLRFQENAKPQFDLNFNLIFESVAYAGVSYRSSNALTFVFQLILNDNLRAGYAYETETSSINAYSPGSHEILVNYRIKIRNAKKDPQCPVYF